MKNKTIVVGLLILTCLSVYFVFKKANPIKKTDTNDVTHDTEVLGTSEGSPDYITLNDLTYKVFTTPFFDGENISLIPNFSEKKLASDIKESNECDYLVNAGFYTQEARPVGYFKSSVDTLKNEKESLLFDAFFTINKLLTPRITRTLPKDELLYGVQVGPLLIENAKVLPLSIKNDKYARRIVLIVNGDNKVMYQAIVSETSDFSGPKMADIPEILSLWSTKTNTPIADAVNLDGGSASSFLTPTVSLNEISPIGSAFCIKLN